MRGTLAQPWDWGVTGVGLTHHSLIYPKGPRPEGHVSQQLRALRRQENKPPHSLLSTPPITLPATFEILPLPAQQILDAQIASAAFPLQTRS